MSPVRDGCPHPIRATPGNAGGMAPLHAGCGHGAHPRRGCPPGTSVNRDAAPHGLLPVPDSEARVAGPRLHGQEGAVPASPVVALDRAIAQLAAPPDDDQQRAVGWQDFCSRPRIGKSACRSQPLRPGSPSWRFCRERGPQLPSRPARLLAFVRGGRRYSGPGPGSGTRRLSGSSSGRSGSPARRGS